MLAAAWAGAGLFLASLVYFGWFYAVALGRPAPAPPEGVPAAVAVNVVLFSLFALHHSVLARAAVKRRVTALLPPALERTVYVWVASLLFLAVCLLWRPVPGLAWQASGPLAWALRAAQLAGVALTLASASRIDIWDLAGVRQARAARSSAQLETAPSATLPTSASSGAAGASTLEVAGPYRWVRHPIYLGWVLMVFGAPAMTAGRLLFAAISTAYLIAAIPFEERSLVTEFGPPYQDYQRRVRWRLVPGLW